jgi:hypothetical protein
MTDIMTCFALFVAILSAADDATFLQDTYDEDAAMSNVYGDELITNHRLKKIKPLYVNYARTAKRVDVRRLKDNLWKTLTTQPVCSIPLARCGSFLISCIISNLTFS